MTRRSLLALALLLPATLAAQQPRSLSLGVGTGSLVRDLGFAGTASASGTVLQLDGTVGLGGPLALTLGATGWGRDDRRYLTVVGEQDTRTDGRRDGLRLPVQ